ncbi:Retrovirus-related Pol polyprotein from transposon 17.6 [Golovinomyces cichoracearum]|uniref:Retrovirus-related Pol polyprotein from transposon 17.6 n=1 Tax=Golovinomyces cichoracearum TaxID=62708 RepID=A0A420IU17_9PEZI|nr:Retrovirus-related Pol polyprotein from transposon 17.6 [Golovinomyces cichoracearum]
MNIALPEGWIIDLDSQLLTLPYFAGIQVHIVTIKRDKECKIPVFSATKCVIHAQSRSFVAIASSKGETLSILQRDLIYEPIKQQSCTTFAHLVSGDCKAIMMENSSDRNVTISRYQPLGNLIDLDAQFMTSLPKSATKRLFMKDLLVAVAMITNTKTMKSKPQLDGTRDRKETFLTNGITIFGDSQQTKKFQLIIQQNAELWQERQNIAKVTKGEEMTIDLCDEWKNKYKPAVAECPFISKIDCASFIYQWSVKKEHQHRLTVASHRGQETFTCAVMEVRNSQAYVQRRIDSILRAYRSFARAHIDDIFIFSSSLNENLDHLEQVFEKLREFHIFLSPRKCFLNYPSISILGQKANALGLASEEDKLTAIQYIPHYARRSSALQARKIKFNRLLLEEGFNDGANRKREAAHTRISEVTSAEKEAFISLQRFFMNTGILHHCDPYRKFYADFDSLKHGMGAMVYHSEIDPPTQKSVQPIMFLSSLLKPAEENYWPTELEIARLCWVISKIRTLIESSKNPTIIYTDHQAAIQIATQTSLTTRSLVRLNPRHRRSSEYLSRFQLEVRHKAGRLNELAEENKTLAYLVISLQIGQSWLQKLKRAYSLDPQTSKLIQQLQENEALEINEANLLSEYYGGILFTKLDEIHQEKRPVIPKSTESEVFTYAHDQLGHMGFDRIH